MQREVDIAPLLKYYERGEINECTKILKLLQTTITQCLKDTRGFECSSYFYSSLVEILSCEVSKHSSHSPAHFGLISSVICCLRNSFYQSPSNQLTVSQSEDLMSNMINALKFLLKLMESSSEGQDSHEKESIESIKQASSSCATCFVNMMAGNTRARKNVWRHLQPYHREMILLPQWEVAHLFCAVLHNLLLEPSIREEICRDTNFGELVSKLLSLYLHEGPNSCFVLFCLKDFLCSAKVLPLIWDDLAVKESLLSLDILSSVLLSDSTADRGPFPHWEVIRFFCDKFKKNADQILCTHDGRLHLIEPKVVAKLLGLMCSAAASDTFCKSLQGDKSLLITTVYLLKGITDIGDLSGNCFSRLNDTPDQEAELEKAPSHPSFGFKSELIRLVAGLVFRNKANQDTIRENKGIELLLENSQFDGRNPFIREESIFALRNLLEGNEDNQSYIKNFSCEGVASNPILRQLGLQADVCQGKLIIQQR